MNQPRPESRISELESQMSIQGARIRELSDDTAESLIDLKKDIGELKQSNKELFDHVQLGFTQAHTFIMENIASKEDLVALEDRLKFETNQRLSRLEQHMGTMESKLDLILQLLQPRQQ